MTYFFDKYAEKFDKHMSDTGHYSAQIRLLNKMKSTIKEPILDAGCGTGELIKHLEKDFDKIYGNDIAKNMIKIAKTKTNKTLYYNYSTEELKTVQKFSTIICCNLFYYIKNKPRALACWKEHLLPKGRLILMEETPFVRPKGNMDNESKELVEIVNPISLYEIVKIIENNKFQLENRLSTKIDNKHRLYALTFK